MVYNRRHAAGLASAAELELFEASLGSRLRAHEPAALRRLIQRARRLRDKQRDLLRRQGLRPGSRPAGDANLRTRQKQKLFEEALERFERRLEELEQSGRPAPRGRALQGTKEAAARRARTAGALQRKAGRRRAKAELDRLRGKRR